MFEGKAFVNMSVNCKFERMDSTLRKPSTISSLTKWQSIYMCLVLSWNVGLEAIAIVVWLSQNIIVGRIEVIFKSFKVERSMLTHWLLRPKIYTKLMQKILRRFPTFLTSMIRGNLPRKCKNQKLIFWCQAKLPNLHQHKL